VLQAPSCWLLSIVRLAVTQGLSPGVWSAIGMGTLLSVTAAAAAAADFLVVAAAAVALPGNLARTMLSWKRRHRQ
jgi:hypothetical protein